MLRLRKTLLVAGLLLSPIAAFGQAAPGQPGKKVVDLDQPVVPALPDVLPPNPMPSAPAANVDQGYFTGGNPDHRYLPDDYLFPDFAWLKRDRAYRWDGRLRLDIDYLTMKTTTTAGGDDSLQGARLGFLLWLDKDQRLGVQANLLGSVNNLDDITDISDIAGDVIDGITSLDTVLGARTVLGPSAVFGAELLGRGLLFRSDNFRLDALLGVRTFGFGSGLVSRDIRAAATPAALLTQAGLNPTQTNQIITLAPNAGVPFVNFSGRAIASTWVGGEAGLAAEYWFGRIWLDGIAKIGYGQSLGVGRIETFTLNPQVANLAPTATRTSIDVDQNKSSFLNEFGIGGGFMISRHLALRAGYSYMRIGNMFQSDVVPAFRSYNLHTVNIGLSARF